MIRSEDLDGNEIEETYYFHMNEAELAKMRLSHGGDLEAYMRKIVATQDADAMIALFEEIILTTVGKKSDDGKRFIKDDGRIAREFKETDAYSVLFLELLQGDGSNFLAFFRQVIPSKSQQKFEENLKAQGRIADAVEQLQTAPEAKAIVDVLPNFEEASQQRPQPKDDVPAFIREKRPPTKEELLAMTPEEINKAFKGQ